MKKQTISLKDNAPKINFGSLKSRNYSVSVKYFDGETTSSSKRIDYETGFTITPNKNIWLLDIHKHSFWFDGHEPDLISELIADELSKTIYPVQAKINEQGTFLEISNFNHIVNSRWYRNKLKATEKYTTQIAKSFYDAFERNLENRNVFEKSMQYDLFWNLLFHPKYIDYGNEHSVKTDLYLAVVPYEYPIQFTGKQKVNTEITDYHSVEIHFRSDEMKAHDYFIPKNKIASKDNIFMRLDVYYDLDVYYLFPMHTRAYFEVYSKDTEGRKTPIKRIEFSQYQQDTEANKITIAEKRSPFQVYEEDENEKEIYKTYEGKNYTYQEWKKFEDEQYKLYKEKKSKRGFWDFLG
ncbi:hypothetical protein GCM10023210_26930 [Chryseobacterium ginsengisoli]|uniref:Uncharacterized protein n=1 Tax=Chryseobacterium ginsengisoli TaxID=363853 RepID=A0ABP9MI31_9FLAO